MQTAQTEANTLSYEKRLTCGRFKGANIFYLRSQDFLGIQFDDGVDNPDMLDGFYFRYDDEPAQRRPYGPYHCVADCANAIDLDQEQ